MEGKYCVVKEGTFGSIISDTYTFVCLVAAFYLNHEYLGDNTVLSVVLGLCFFAAVLARGTNKVKTFKSVEEAVEWLQED
jgi:hypothetical protein